MSALQAQRQNSRVCPNELKKVWYGSVERFDSFSKAVELTKKVNPPEVAYSFWEKDRPAQIKHAYNYLAEFIRSKHYDPSKGDLPIELNYLVNFEIPGSVSALMVRPIIAVLCTEKQKQKWLPLFDTGRVVGVYAQTELGHGSDVQGLETEAVYDEKTREFIINSPSVSSYKWWPGEISNVSSIAVVFARLILKGKRAGVLPFIVQIRDMETHQPMPGVEIGDIGPKFGYFAKENGFLKFTNVRIPKENMPARFTGINKNGDLVKKGNPKIIYSSMMKSRSALLEMSSYMLGRGAAIALRYSFVRKQFKNEAKEEIPVVQYQLQQARLFPLLAKAYAMRCSFNKIVEVINTCNDQIAKYEDFGLLQETHVLLSGAKAWYTWWCNNGLWVCMNCCGGHGYSKWSGISFIIETSMPNTILEGENTMLSLQVGAFLLKCMKNIHEGKLDKVTGYCQYLKDVDGLMAFNEGFKEDLTDLQKMKRLWQKAVLAKISSIGERIITESTGESITQLVGKKLGIQVFESAKLHTILFTFDYFLQYIEGLSCGHTKQALTNLARLFIAEQTAENAQILVGLEVIGAEQLQKIAKQIEPTLEAIFPDCVTLSDALVIDEQLNYSALADPNEKPYENLYHIAKNYGVLNKIDLTKPYLDLIRAASKERFPDPKL